MFGLQSANLPLLDATAYGSSACDIMSARRGAINNSRLFFAGAALHFSIMEGPHILMLLLALAAAGGMFLILRWFLKRLRRIQEERWGEQA